MAAGGVDGRRHGQREEGEGPVSKHQIQPWSSEEMAGWRGTGRPKLSREDRFLRLEWGYFSYSADHEQDFDPCTAISDEDKCMDQTCKVGNPARGQLKREDEYFTVPVRA